MQCVTRPSHTDPNALFLSTFSVNFILFFRQFFRQFFLSTFYVNFSVNFSVIFPSIFSVYFSVYFPSIFSSNLCHIFPFFVNFSVKSVNFSVFFKKLIFSSNLCEFFPILRQFSRQFSRQFYPSIFFVIFLSIISSNYFLKKLQCLTKNMSLSTVCLVRSVLPTRKLMGWVCSSVCQK